MRAKTMRFNKKIFYAPRGLLVDYSDEETLTFFVNNIKKYWNWLYFSIENDFRQ